MKKVIISFLLIITLVCNCPISVQASSEIDFGNEVLLSNVDIGNALRLLLEQIGVVLNPSLWGTGSLYDRYYDFLENQAVIDSSESYEDYIKSHLKVEKDENGELTYSADTEIVNNLYNFAVQTIEEETGWYEWKTTDYRTIPLNIFTDKTVYDAFISYCKTNLDNTNNMIIYSGYVYDSNVSNYYVQATEPVIDFDLYLKSGTSSGGHAYVCKNWSQFSPPLVKVYNDNVNYMNAISFNFAYFLDGFQYEPLTDGVKIVRVYKTLEQLKAYSIGQRPYYITDAFKSYDSTVDNSTTITQTEIDNSVTYGDVYNYITNNYENPDGLSEDDLRAILAEYLSSINNSGGSGSGSGSGSDSGSSGGGLGSFLEGLGSIGDAILSILGKLLEYIGKALELLTGTVTKVLDLIPSNVTNLLLGLFPFIPQEWITAIELSLVLGVVLAVVGAFKK